MDPARREAPPDTRSCGRRIRLEGTQGPHGSRTEAYVAECAAIARALETAARRRNKLDHLTIFADAQAAIWRITSDDQRYAIAARKHIAELRRKEPDIRIETRWHPSHCGVEGNEKADEWAKQAADEPDARGVEWHRYMDRCGRKSAPPCSLAQVLRGQVDRHQRVGQGRRTSNSKYRTSDKQRPNATVARANKKLAARFYRPLPHGTIPAVDHEKARRQVQVCNYKTQTREHLFKNCPQWKSQQKGLWATVRE